MSRIREDQYAELTALLAVGESLKRRALVVETDPIALSVCRQVVENAGFAVQAVDSGIAAVIAARNERPEFILVAPQLRDVPGLEAIGWLRGNAALLNTPIIVLPQPVTPDSLRRTIRDVLALKDKS